MEAAEPSRPIPDLPLGMCPVYPGMPEQTPLDRNAVLERLSFQELQLLAGRNPDDTLRRLSILQEAHRATGIPPTIALQWGASVAQGLTTSSAVHEIDDEWGNAASRLLEQKWKAKFWEVRDIINGHVKGAQAHPENGTLEIGRWTIAVPRGNDFELRHLEFLINDHKHFLVFCKDFTEKSMKTYPKLKVVHNEDEFAKISKELQPSLIDRLHAFSRQVEKRSKAYKETMDFFDDVGKSWEKLPEKWRGRIKQVAVAALVAVCSAFEGSQIGHQTQAVFGPVLKIVMPQVPPGAADALGMQDPISPRIIAQAHSSLRRS